MKGVFILLRWIRGVGCLPYHLAQVDGVARCVDTISNNGNTLSVAPYTIVYILKLVAIPRRFRILIVRNCYKLRHFGGKTFRRKEDKINFGIMILYLFV